MNNLDYTQTGNTNIDAINKNRATLVSSGFDPYTGAAQPNITPSPLPANISTDTVGSGTSPVNIPSPNPTPTTANALDASSATSITQAHNALQTELQGQKDTAQTSLDTTTGKLQSLFGDKTQILNDKITAMQTPEFLAKQKATVDAQNQLDQQNQAQLAETNATNQNGALTNDQKTLAIGAINNKYAFGKANLSLSLDIANRNYTSAQNTINQTAQLKMEALQPQIDYYSSFLSSNEANLSKSEQNILQQKIDDSKTAQTQAYQNTKDNGDAMIKYNSLGAGITINDSAQERDQKIASVGGELAYTSAQEKAKNSATGLLSITEAQALGVPYGTTKQQAMGITPQKPATTAQETTALYANRIEQSNSILSKLDDTVAAMNPVKYATNQKLPQIFNGLKDSSFQSVDQAQRNFVNAVLRRESGAAISPAEFENARQQYFAQPGDSPNTITQKKANRDLVQQGFISGAGNAYSPMVSNSSTIPKGTDGTSYGHPGYVSDGTQWVQK